jgi:hypothetical protein
MSTNIAVMVIAIVLITTIGRIYRAKHGLADPRRERSRSRTAPDSSETSAENERMRDEIKTLKERIVVLERITTDNNAAVSLDREIEKLR